MIDDEIREIITEIDGWHTGHQEWLIRLFQKIREAGKSDLPESARADLAREIYWHHPPIPIHVVAHQFGVTEQEFARLAGPQIQDVPCSRCYTFFDMTAADHEEAARLYRLFILCEDCSKEEQKRRDAENQALHEQRLAASEEVKAARLQLLKTMPYVEYLLTPEWQERRRAALDRDGHACRLCGSDKSLNVHHRTYERRGEEPPEDLTTLCHGCHQNFHQTGSLTRPD